MVIRYIIWKRHQKIDDRFMEKHMPELASLTAKLSRGELERACQRLQKNQWDTKTFGKFRGAKIANLLRTCIELLLMGLIEHVDLVGIEKKGQNNVSEDRKPGKNSGKDSDQI